LQKKEHLMKFSSFRLLVGDFSTAVRFWRDLIGLSLTFSDEEHGYAYFDMGGVGLELFQRDINAAAFGAATPAPAPVGQQAIISLRVDDVDATYADLVKRGAPSFAPPQDRPAWQARTAHLSGPDGYVVEVFSSLEQS
jgi:predicted enzyme related to lactoylglutathione lyase